MNNLSGPGRDLLDSSAEHFRVSRRRKDRHGRIQRGLNYSPTLPLWRTRRELFDHQVAEIVGQMCRRFPAVASIEFAVEEVPPSVPAPWEDHDVCLSRVFPRDRKRNLADRIVVYRHGVIHRCSAESQQEFLRLLLAERISQVLALDPEDLIF